jgi:hypothetical protein
MTELRRGKAVVKELNLQMTEKYVGVLAAMVEDLMEHGVSDIDNFYPPLVEGILSPEEALVVINMWLSRAAPLGFEESPGVPAFVERYDCDGETA